MRVELSRVRWLAADEPPECAGLFESLGPSPRSGAVRPSVRAPIFRFPKRHPGERPVLGAVLSLWKEFSKLEVGPTAMTKGGVARRLRQGRRLLIRAAGLPPLLLLLNYYPKSSAGA